MTNSQKLTQCVRKALDEGPGRVREIIDRVIASGYKFKDRRRLTTSVRVILYRLEDDKEVVPKWIYNGTPVGETEYRKAT